MDAKTLTQAPPKIEPILPETPEMEAFLGIGYSGLTVKDAETIVAAAKENALIYPIEQVNKAKAFLEAYYAKPKVVAKRHMWQRPVRA